MGLIPWNPLCTVECNKIGILKVQDFGIFELSAM